MVLNKLLEELKEFNIVADPLKDQFFLNDEKVIKKIVGFGGLNKKDIVLDIGAGLGNITKEIAKKAGRVLAFESDIQFKPLLVTSPKNVEIYYLNVLDYLETPGKFRKGKQFNKIIANPPYSIIEPLLHLLTRFSYHKVILVVPLKFLKISEKWGIFGAFYEPKILLKIPKTSFFPQPKTNSVVIDLVKHPDPIQSKNLGRFLRQYVYRHKNQLVKNSLMEGLIKYHKGIFSKFLSKNQARDIISGKAIEKKILDYLPETSQVYEVVEKQFNS